MLLPEDWDYDAWRHSNLHVWVDEREYAIMPLTVIC
jgi:hypothetical protein